MSQSHKGRTPSGRSATPSPSDPVYLPRKAEELVGGNRLAGVEAERRDAAAQIGRSLKAWRKAGGQAGSGPAAPSGSGSPLSGDARARMEPRLGADLSAVRVHSDGAADQNAKAVNARAFTIGNDVHFGAGELAPGTREGDRLLAHELTHVVQGQRGGIQRKADEPEDKGTEVSQPHEPAEQEADQVADHVAEELHDGDDQRHDEEGAHEKGDRRRKKKKAGDDPVRKQQQEARKQTPLEKEGSDEKVEPEPNAAAEGAIGAAPATAVIHRDAKDSSKPKAENEKAKAAELRQRLVAARARIIEAEGSVARSSQQAHGDVKTTFQQSNLIANVYGDAYESFERTLARGKQQADSKDEITSAVLGAGMSLILDVATEGIFHHAATAVKLTVQVIAKVCDVTADKLLLEPAVETEGKEKLSDVEESLNPHLKELTAIKALCQQSFALDDVLDAARGMAGGKDLITESIEDLQAIEGDLQASKTFAECEKAASSVGEVDGACMQAEMQVEDMAARTRYMAQMVSKQWGLADLKRTERDIWVKWMEIKGIKPDDELAHIDAIRERLIYLGVIAQSESTEYEKNVGNHGLANKIAMAGKKVKVYGDLTPDRAGLVVLEETGDKFQAVSYEAHLPARSFGTVLGVGDGDPKSPNPLIVCKDTNPAEDCEDFDPPIAPQDDDVSQFGGG